MISIITRDQYESSALLVILSQLAYDYSYKFKNGTWVFEIVMDYEEK